MNVMLIVVKIANSFHLPVLTSRNVDLFRFNSSSFPAQQELASQQSWEHKCSEVKWFAQGQTAVRLLILSLDCYHHDSKAQQCSEKHLSYNLRAQGSSFRCSKHRSSSVTLMVKDPDLWLSHVLTPLSLVPPCGLQKSWLLLYFSTFFVNVQSVEESQSGLTQLLTVFSFGHSRNMHGDWMGRSEPHLRNIETFELGGRHLHSYLLLRGSPYIAQVKAA